MNPEQKHMMLKMANLGLQSVHEPISDVTVAVSIFYTQTGPSVFITAGVKGSHFSFNLTLVST